MLLAAMAIVGVLQMRRGIAGLRPHGPTADATSETIFASLTGQRDVPRRLAAELARLPEGRPVLILRPPNDFLSALPAYMVAYQSMPRPAVIRELQIVDSAAAVEELRRSFAAIVFVRQSPPPAFPAGQQFGSSFTFVPLGVSP